MTERRDGGARRVVRVPRATTTVAVAGVLLTGTLGLLGVQMATGHDPALGPAAPAVALPATVERRVVRRVIVTRVVTDRPAAGSPAAVATTRVTVTAPVVRAVPPRASAAAPAVRTRTS